MFKTAAPIVGFRFWLWPPLFPAVIRDCFHWGDSMLLWGTVGLYPWVSAQTQAIHAWTPPHREPFENCLCGLHGFTHLPARPQLKWFDQWPSAMMAHEHGLVAGAIVAWGRVAEHGSARRSEGFRAQHARILALSQPEAATLYRVPYVAEQGLELYAAEFGLRLDELHQ